MAADPVPDCTGAEAWPASIAFTMLKNDGALTSETIDPAKTTVARLSSEKIGDNLFRQIHDVKFSDKSGKVTEVITASDASAEECSMGNVDIYYVSKRVNSGATADTK